MLSVQEWTELAKMVFRLKPLHKAARPPGKLRTFCFTLLHMKVSCLSTPMPFLIYLRQTRLGQLEIHLLS